MGTSVRCRLTGCDRDPCGVCKRCGDEQGAAHDWQDGERQDPCYRHEVCSRCSNSRDQPDHDWNPVVTAAGTNLSCSRCGLEI